jgi:tryptophanyl-tRNA synthetase
VTRILSGIQPTGEIHLGNYLGALRHWVARQADAECLFLIADLHAITTPQDPGELRKRTWGTATLLLSLGIDPKRSILFLQSQVGYHAELAWVLNCLTRVGELRRMVQFKEKESRRDETGATAGLFTYPVLQAADILLYQADGVPVGEDQKQHLELARDLAQRFNNRFSATFTIPEPLIAPMGARIMDLQNPQKKMSKSSESPLGTICLTDRPEEIQAKIQSAVTDSGYEIKTSIDKPAISNLLEIYSIVGGVDIRDTEEMFAGKTYVQFKKALADSLVEYLRPVRERYEQIAENRDRIERVLTKGSEKAKAMAAQTLHSVYDHLGFVQPRTHIA